MDLGLSPFPLSIVAALYILFDYQRAWSESLFDFFSSLHLDSCLLGGHSYLLPSNGEAWPRWLNTQDYYYY